jgi:hypothetical protein
MRPRPEGRATKQIQNSPDRGQLGNRVFAQKLFLARFDGDVEELVRKLAGMFIAGCSKYLNDMREAVRAGDAMRWNIPHTRSGAPSSIFNRWSARIRSKAGNAGEI